MITLADAKTFLGVSDDTEDTIIQSFIDAASSLLGNAAHTVFTPATTRTRIMDGTGTLSLWLDELPISITSIHVSSDQEWTDANLVDSDDYRLDCQRIISLETRWSEGSQNCQVIYVVGYSVDDMPEDLQLAAKVQVAKIYNEWKASMKGLNIVSQQRVEGWTQVYIARRKLDPVAEEIIRKYTVEDL